MALCGSRATDAIDGDEAPTLSAMRTRLGATVLTAIMMAGLAACKGSSDGTATEAPDAAALHLADMDAADPSDPRDGVVTNLGRVKFGDTSWFVFAWITAAHNVCFDLVVGNGSVSEKGCPAVPKPGSITPFVEFRCTSVVVYGPASPAMASVELEAGQLVASSPVIDLGLSGGVDYKAYLVSLNLATTHAVDVNVTARAADGEPVASMSFPAITPALGC
jgi:hypothetical protein